jgi:hypothetical protein
MLHDLIVAQIKTAVPELKKVSLVADLASAKADAKSFPCAYVLTLSEQGGLPRYMSGVVAQQRTARIGVVLAVRNVRDAAGTAAAGDMDALRAQVDAALFGWKPDEAHGALIFTGGALLALLDGEVWWRDEYTTAFDRR